MEGKATQLCNQAHTLAHITYCLPPGHPHAFLPPGPAGQAGLEDLGGEGAHVALARPSVDVGLEPYPSRDIRGSVVTQVWKASCQALGPALEQAAVWDRTCPVACSHCPAQLRCPQHCQPKPAPCPPVSESRAWLEGAGLGPSSDN